MLKKFCFIIKIETRTIFWTTYCTGYISACFISIAFRHNKSFSRGIKMLLNNLSVRKIVPSTMKMVAGCFISKEQNNE